MRKTMLATMVAMAMMVGPVHAQVAEAPADTPSTPQQAAVESALIKNVVTTITNGPDGVRKGLETMQRDLELALKGQ